MPDTYAIVAARRRTALNLRMTSSRCRWRCSATPAIRIEAARRLVDLGAGAIITLGGDGTNRVVAKGCGDVPLVADLDRHQQRLPAHGRGNAGRSGRRRWSRPAVAGRRGDRAPAPARRRASTARSATWR